MSGTAIFRSDDLVNTKQVAPLEATVALPDAPVHGQTTVTTAGTAVALGESTTLTSGVRIKANSDNTGVIYVGASDVDSTTGFVLAAGEELFVEIADLADVFIDAGTSADGVSYIGG